MARYNVWTIKEDKLERKRDRWSIEAPDGRKTKGTLPQILAYLLLYRFYGNPAGAEAVARDTVEEIRKARR